MRRNRGLSTAALVLCTACGGSDPAPDADSGGMVAGGQAVGMVAGSSAVAGRSSRNPFAGGLFGGSAGRTSSTSRAGTSGGLATAGQRATAGTSGGAAGTSSTGTVAGTGSTASGATFTAVYAIFTNRCAGTTCHVGANGNGGDGLNMNDKATAYRNLVGVNAGSCRGEKRVVAGNPDKSELYHSIAHTKLGSCSPPQMPLALPLLPQAEIDTVASWIRGGAPNN